jgi:hypothetical protein
MEQVATISQITTTAANDSQKDIVRMETTMRQLAEATNAIAALSNIEGCWNFIGIEGDRSCPQLATLYPLLQLLCLLHCWTLFARALYT